MGNTDVPDCIYKADATVFCGVTALLLICTAVVAKHSGIAVRDVAGALQAEDAGQETAGWRRYLPVFYLTLFCCVC